MKTIALTLVAVAVAATAVIGSAEARGLGNPGMTSAINHNYGRSTGLQQPIGISAINPNYGRPTGLPINIADQLKPKPKPGKPGGDNNNPGKPGGNGGGYPGGISGGIGISLVSSGYVADGDCYYVRRRVWIDGVGYVKKRQLVCA